MKTIFILLKSILKFSVPILLFIIQSNTFAQTIKSTISGIVLDPKKESIIDVNILLLKAADSSYVCTTTTASDGSFSLETQPNKYILSASIIGFQKQSLLVDFADSGSILMKPIILEEDFQELKEVTIVGNKNTIEFEAGKTLVTPGASIVNSQGNTFEVLRNIPGLIINEDGTILLNGQSGVNIQINKKETYLSGIALTNFLKSTAAASIAKIEILTSPSAEYDASGKAGIINIRLKKTPKEGITFSPSVNYQQGKDPRADIVIRSTLRKEKIGFSIDYFHSEGKKAKKGSIYREYLPVINDTSAIMKTASQYVSLTNSDNTDNFKFVTDFDLTKCITLDSYLGAAFLHRRIPGNSNTTFSKYNTIENSSLNTSTYSNYRQATFNGGISAEYKDKNKREVNFSIDYLSFNHNENTQMFSKQINSLTMLIKTDNLLGDLDGDINILSTQSNISIPLLSDKIKLQTGGKISSITIRNQAIYDNQLGDKLVSNLKYSSKYGYQENNTAAYIQSSGKFDNWSFQTGLRIENTQINGTIFDIKQIKKDSTYRIRYFKMFPNVTLTYNITDSQNLSLVYNRRITRPNYRDLSPFDYMVDEYTISKGNPKLNPELTHNLEMAFVFKKIYRANFFYTSTDNAIAKGFEVLENGGLLITPQNIASNKRTGIKLDAGRLINLKWWQMSTSISAFYTENKWIEFDKINKTSQITPLANCNNQFTITKSWTAQLTGYYNGKMSFGQMKIPVNWSVSGGIRKKLINDNLNINLYVNDIFASIREKASFESSSIKGHSNVRFDETSVGISIYYNFKRDKSKEKEDKNNSIEESKRINF